MMDTKNHLDQLSIPKGRYRDRSGVVDHFVVHLFRSLQQDKLKSGQRGQLEINHLYIKVRMDDFRIYLFLYFLSFVDHIIVKCLHMDKKCGQLGGRVVVNNSRPFSLIPFAIG